jgi:hypothetical protein
VSLIVGVLLVKLMQKPRSFPTKLSMGHEIVADNLADEKVTSSASLTVKLTLLLSPWFGSGSLVQFKLKRTIPKNKKKFDLILYKLFMIIVSLKC